ncbi:hypothetical protein EKO04_010303 [Ascochyta lentis]|uniref:Uncharacterized protein n=1 Tax=Ascochyta lentis TaxID=205686 RepID=A0A8H7ISX5_9PLEO|nr:hypothetical protein EKO04_010303 [Ascochyta lentis]
MALSTNSNNFLAQKAIGRQQQTDHSAFIPGSQRSEQQQQQANECNTGQVEESDAITQQKETSMSIELSMVSPQQLCDLRRRNARSQQLLDHQTMECDSFHTDRLDAQRQMADLASRLQIAEDTLRQERDLRADLDTKARLAQQNLEEEWINEIEETKTLNRQLRADLEESSKVVSARSVETVRQEQELNQLRSQLKEVKSQVVVQFDKEKSQIVAQYKKEKSQIVAQHEEEKSQVVAQFDNEKSQIVAQYKQEKSQVVAQFNKEKSQIVAQFDKEKSQAVAQYDKASSQLRIQLEERGRLHASEQELVQELRSKLCETETLNTKMTGSIEDLTSKQNELVTDLETRKKHIRRAENNIAVKDGLIEQNSAELTELRREMNLKQADFNSLRKQLQQAVDVIKKSFQTGMILRKDLATTHSQLRNETDTSKTLRDEVTRVSKLSEGLSTELQTSASTIQGMQAIATATATDTEGLRCGLADAELKIQRLVIDLSSSKTMSEEMNNKLVEVEAGLTDAETKLTDAETKLTEANATIVMKNQKINSTETTARDALAQNERLQNSLSSLQLADERHRIQLATAEGKAGSCKSDFDQSEAARSALLRFIFMHMVLGLEESGVEDTLAETRDSEHGLVETTQTQIARFLSAWEIETLSVAGLEQHLSAASETNLVLRNKLESLLLKYRLDMQAWSDKMERRVNSDKVRFDTALSTARSAKSKYERDVDILETRIETLVEELSTVSEEFSIIKDYFETNKGFVLQ